MGEANLSNEMFCKESPSSAVSAWRQQPRNFDFCKTVCGFQHHMNEKKNQQGNEAVFCKQCRYTMFEYMLLNMSPMFCDYRTLTYECFNDQ